MLSTLSTSTRRKATISGMRVDFGSGPPPVRQRTPQRLFSSCSPAASRRMMLVRPATQYNGYRFRSRLEARWAVFFNALHIKYVYEKEDRKSTRLNSSHL